MAKMRVIQVPRAGEPLELVERDVPEPQPGWVRVKVEACGICHSDSLIKEGLWPGIQYPRVPGHEVIGVVDAVGERVKPWKTGQRVGVGWHGGNCGYCDHCRRGEFFACEVALLTTGISFDGGYAEYMVAPAEALALVPEELSAVEGAPLMCAGVTTFNALRTAVPEAAMLSRCSALAGSVISACSSQPGWNSRPWRLRVGKTRKHLPKNSAHTAAIASAFVTVAITTCAPPSLLSSAAGSDAWLSMTAVLGGLSPNGVFL